MARSLPIYTTQSERETQKCVPASTFTVYDFFSPTFAIDHETVLLAAAQMC